jgi:histone chaperone ASF1
LNDYLLDIEWKVTYVGSANDPSKDQVLEEVLVGPVTVGVNRFILQSAPPDHTAISVPDLVGVTVLLITCSYMDEEFVRIG